MRITLQEGILQDTEVIISKDGKALNITFVTGSDDSANILNHRSGELRTQLMEKLSDVTQIEIEVEQHNLNDNQNSGGQSQNQSGGQQQQGEEEGETMGKEEL